MINVIRWWRSAVLAAAIEAEKHKDVKEKAAIARAFNNRYTFRRQYVEGKPRLEGTAIFGINPHGGNAWMCPECNKIHHPTDCTVWTGLQYPQCCGTPAGDRLNRGIKADN